MLPDGDISVTLPMTAVSKASTINKTLNWVVISPKSKQWTTDVLSSEDVVDTNPNVISYDVVQGGYVRQDDVA